MSIFENKRMFGLIATLSLVVIGAQSRADSFSHNFALKRMLPLAAAAYSDTPRKCVDRLGGNVVKFYKTDCSGPLGRFAIGKVYCSAYTALFNKEKAIVLSFRGTDSRLQLVKEFFHPLLDKKWFGDASVNTYFLSAFHSLFTTRTNNLGRSMLEDAKDLIRTHSGYDIWITGHSLGGALASLVASYLVESGNAEMSRVKLMTFGQPRTGDQKFAERVNKMNYAFRVIHDNDLVPQVPPKKFGYYHHKKEVYYGQTMENGIFKVCNKDECGGQFMPDPKIFGDQRVHRCYYGKLLSEWAKDGCDETKTYKKDCDLEQK